MYFIFEEFYNFIQIVRFVMPCCHIFIEVILNCFIYLIFLLLIFLFIAIVGNLSFIASLDCLSVLCSRILLACNWSISIIESILCFLCTIEGTIITMHIFS